VDYFTQAGDEKFKKLIEFRIECTQKEIQGDVEEDDE
jgi:hypothetical protein